MDKGSMQRLLSDVASGNKDIPHVLSCILGSSTDTERFA